MKKQLVFAITLLVVIGIASVSKAQTKDETFRDWTVYHTTLQGKKTCYIASFPVSQTGNYKRRDEPYFLVTRISDNIEEVSTSSGYKYKENSDVTVDAQGKKYNLFTKDELAWAPDSDQDKSMIERMKKKSHMTVRGTSTLGTYSVDKYSLMGFTDAFNRMKKLCQE